ncbi:terpene synthase family protein [Nonomuraea sp. NPDC049725]|uniref:terpene synthase family protein n=1 Tax=Nonomuraea sp. NPDC049725 TaxID=3154508 RepID=UPI003435C837
MIADSGTSRTSGIDGSMPAVGGAELGRTCALAVECARELARDAGRHPELFPAKPFDAGFYHSLALVGAFGSPWATARELRAVNRAALWVFAVDLLIDHVATSRDEVADLVGACLAVADGAEPRTPATRFLAELRDEAGSPAWRDQLGRMLAAMAREWDWRTGDRPDLATYLDNADSTGSSFVNLAHWNATGDPWTLANLDRVRAVGDEVQRYLRLLNDLATRDREAGWGDVNALTLGAGHAEVTARMGELSQRAVALIEPLRDTAPRTALYLERQLTFNTGFYGLADFWGAL